MSFFSITSLKKREELAKENLQTKRNILKSDRLEKTGVQEETKMSKKLFKPITDESKKLNELFNLKLLPAIKNTNAISYPFPLAIDETTSTDGAEHLVGKYPLELMGSKITDSLGINSDGKNFYIGNKKVYVDNNDIFLDGKQYEGTKGLWNLLAKKQPKDFTEQDVLNYEELLLKTNSLHQGNDPSRQAKSSQAYKWKHFGSRFWKKHKEDLQINQFHPEAEETPTHLLERFDLLMASKESGNTGLEEELAAINRRLYSMKELTEEQYKDLKEYIES